ncbi:uncharacterized protein LOC120944175 [Rana temporaria]|uniref:uncharacterized protein LOC120944175 n=1 Tax=Rana temporaria TaxID=8407 RepID=UPI001AADAABA|nr:uncharacterized protein LOC120944175 [Rana temporaria]
MSTMSKIVPKSKSKADFCGVDSHYYIVRPDLGCYMSSTDFSNGKNLEVFSLHPSCRNGDHYLAFEDGHFYIIQSNTYRQVSNLSTDGDASVHTLHPNCQGGDHYFSAFGNFYMIFQNRGVYRRTSNLSTDEKGTDIELHEECKNGLYYFGVKDHYYFVRPDDQWGIQYTRSTDFSNNRNTVTFSFDPSVYSFLPGGLAIAKGPSFGKWVPIQTNRNDTRMPYEWKKEFARKVGYEKKKMSNIESNWKVSEIVTAETGGLSEWITKAQFALPPEYGGSNRNTDEENWNEVTEEKEIISLTLNPFEKISFLVYQMGFGKDPVLHCQDMRISNLHYNSLLPPNDSPLPPNDSPLPPNDNPLPPAVI